MNKNLKKVISAAAALTISASSFAALAVDFPDVEATASYYQAVQELSALDVISGFEDGTFKPDELVTRAQITKMIVDALGFRNAAESSKNIATKFADVASGESGHWASGYIATGVSKGFISGHSDTVFAPDDNVTYVQAQKMLVAALGYDSYAQRAGGWPTGYTAYATQTGITNGVTALSEDQLTRAQVAQMIDNAMDVPLIKMNGVESTVFGDYPKYEKMDGTGDKQYETLFTDMKVYKVYGRVTKTPRTDNLDADKVEFQIEKADNFDDEEVKANDPVSQEMYIGNTDALSMVRTYAQALIQKNDDDEFTLLSLTPAAANKTVSLLADDFADVRSAENSNALYFYPTGKNSGAIKYPLDENISVFINGVQKDDMDEAAVEAYIKANDTALVTLQKETKTGSTNASSDYNVIMITSYGTAVVDYVTDKANSTFIYFKDQSVRPTRMELVKDDDSKSYSFTFNGEEIDPADLQEFDVLTISYDTANFDESNFYDVRVSRDTEESAKFKGEKGQGNHEYNFSTGTYKFSVEDQEPNAVNDLSVEFKLYFDVNGRVAYKDEVANSKKIGIVKLAYTEHNGEDLYVDIITKDGQVATFSVDESKKAAVYDAAAKIVTDAKTAAAAVTDNKVGTQYANSVVEYKSTAANKLTEVTLLKADEADFADGDEYRESSLRMGSVKVNDATTIIDVSSDDKDDVKVITADDLQDGVNYTAYGFDKSNGVNRFVVITEGAGGIGVDSKMVVFLESGLTSDEDRDNIVTMTIGDPEEDSAERELILAEKAVLINAKTGAKTDVTEQSDLAGIAEGDPIIYSTNGTGEVDEIVAVYNGVTPGDNWSTFVTDYVLGANTLTDATVDWTDLLDPNEDEKANIVEGIVLKDGSSYILAGADAIDGTLVNTADTIGLDLGNARVYTYNFSEIGGRNHAGISVLDGMVGTPMRDKYYTGSKFDLSKIEENKELVYGVARVFNKNDVQEIYLFIAE